VFKPNEARLRSETSPDHAKVSFYLSLRLMNNKDRITPSDDVSECNSTSMLTERMNVIGWIQSSCSEQV